MTSKPREGEIERAYQDYRDAHPLITPEEEVMCNVTWQAACEWMREQAIQHADAEARDDGTAQRIIERLRGIR